MTPGAVRARYAWTVAPLVLVAVFAVSFNPDSNRWLVNFAWLGALLVWIEGIRRADTSPAVAQRRPRYLWAFLLFVPFFAAAWLPFYDNWRWAQAGDTYPWYWLPAAATRQGLAKSLLSVHGVNDLFTYTQVIVDNFLMFIFGPDFFWHRASNFVVSTLSLFAIYTFFSLILEFPWPVLIVIATAATFHWENFSHISFNHIDSFIFAYSMLALLVRIWREPERRSLWAALGAVGGLSLFFTQTAWAEVMACGITFGVWALATRRLSALGICGMAFLIAGAPVLLQLPGLLHEATTQSRMVLTWEYLSTIFRAILWLPAGRDWNAVEWNGAFAGWPCGLFYAAGLVIAAVSMVPGVRRRLQLPAAVVGLLFLFLGEAALMTLTNNANSNPSPKRTYHLIPLQVFFGLLPLYVVALGVRRSRWLYGAVAGLAFAVVGAYVLATASLFVHPEQFRFGGNIFDGMVQIRQRFPERRVVLFATQTNIKQDVEDRSALINSAYRVGETVAVTPTIDAATVSAACAAGKILCYHNKPEDRPTFERATADSHLRKIEVYAVGEMQCFECASN